MKMSISEILEQVEIAEKRSDKIALLHNYDNPALREVLKYAYHPGIKWLLPKGKPPFKALHYASDAEGRLYSEVKNFYLFVEGGHTTLQQTKRENLFIQLLESVDSQDAVLLYSIKDGILPYKGITPKLVEEAFPGLIST